MGGLCWRNFSTKRIVQPTAPSGIPLHRILEPTFPLPLQESVQQWRKRHLLRESEESLLRSIGLSPNAPDKPYSVQSLDVPVELAADSIQDRLKSPATMNELEVKRADNNNNTDKEKHVVLVHGYGASKGYFYRNLKSLAHAHTVHALDWLGYGLSSRVTPKLPRFEKLSDGVHYGEEWFLRPFEAWRQRRGVERFSIVAHSLGAYLACAYASKYPERVEKLVLVSPASVNRTSESIPGEQLYAEEKERQMKLSQITAKPPKVPRWFKYFWELHWSPFSLVRRTGIWGPKITSGWTFRRFSRLPNREQLALQDYCYRMFNAKGSGEYLLNYFLACGGVGRWPLAERLDKVRCPSLWLYGDHDWMDVKGGEEAVRRLRARGVDAELQLVQNSGHHLYIDNQSSFDQMVQTFLQPNITK